MQPDKSRMYQTY